MMFSVKVMVRTPTFITEVKNEVGICCESDWKVTVVVPELSSLEEGVSEVFNVLTRENYQIRTK